MTLNPEELVFIPLGGSEQFGANLNGNAGPQVSQTRFYYTNNQNQATPQYSGYQGGGVVGQNFTQVSRNQGQNFSTVYRSNPQWYSPQEQFGHGSYSNTGVNTASGPRHSSSVSLNRHAAQGSVSGFGPRGTGRDDRSRGYTRISQGSIPSLSGGPAYPSSSQQRQGKEPDLSSRGRGASATPGRILLPTTPPTQATPFIAIGPAKILTKKVSNSRNRRIDININRYRQRSPQRPRGAIVSRQYSSRYGRRPLVQRHSLKIERPRHRRRRSIVKRRSSPSQFKPVRKINSLTLRKLGRKT